jgi:predicted permease
MRRLAQNIRYAVRVIGRSPGFSAVTVAVLALGIGLNTAIFSVFNALILRELPVWEPGRLVQISGVYRNGSKVPLSFPMFEELQRRQRVFSSVFGWSGIASSNVELHDTVFLADVRAVTGNYYSTLGEKPFLGRLIVPEDARGVNASQVAVISYEFWDRHFGREPSVVGTTIRVEGYPFTIVGVTRKWFTGMTPGAPPEVTIPVGAARLHDLESRSALWMFTTGRLSDAVTMEQARAQVQSFWPQLLEVTVPTQTPGQRRQSFLTMGLNMESAAAGVNTALRSQFVHPLYALMGIVGLILLCVCLNLASLTLARTTTRAHEVSTRIALGARPALIVRQFLVETGVLSAAGAILGVGFSYWGSRALLALLTRGVGDVMLDLRPDWRVFSVAAAAAVLSALLIGLAPGWRMSREAPAAALRRTERALGRGTGALGKALIVVQIAVSLVMLQAAGLFIRTLESLRSHDPGYKRAGIMQAILNPMPQGYKNLDAGTYRKQLLERIAAIPGVYSAAFSTLPVPAGGRGWKDSLSRVSEDPNAAATVLTTLVAVSPDFFRTLGIPIITGREFAWTDDGEHPRVAIVDSGVAKRLGGARGLAGRHIRFGVQPEFQNLEVVGVAGNARLIDIRNSDSPVVYVPFLQHPRFSQRGTVFARTRDAAGFAKKVGDEIQALGHEYASSVSSLERTSEQALSQERATAMLSSFFGALALLLSGIGLFGLMSYAVQRRTQEIGVRIALGSPRRTIVWIVLRETLLLVLAGVAIGIPCAMAVSRLIAHMLFGLSSGDPLTMATASGALFTVGVIAGYLPARRALNMDPAAALRFE